MQDFYFENQKFYGTGNRKNLINSRIELILTKTVEKDE